MYTLVIVSDNHQYNTISVTLFRFDTYSQAFNALQGLMRGYSYTDEHRLSIMDANDEIIYTSTVLMR